MRAIPIALLLLPLAFAGCEKQEPAANEVAATPGVPAKGVDRSHKGQPAPDAAFVDPDGGEISLADFRGTPVLVNLWATWCGPCITEMPTLDRLAKREGESLQLLVLSQDMGEGARAKVDAFFAERRFEKLQPYLDSKMDVMAALKVDTLPTTILYGADGKEIWRMIGIEDWESQDAAKLLAEAKQ